MKQKNFSRMLEILGIEPNRLQPIERPTHFDKIILPDESFFTSGGFRRFTKEYREMIDRIRDFALKNRMPTSNKKIYYFHGRKAQTGEERLAQYFKAKGYEIVLPEKLTLDEQLNLLINCESFVSTVGSCSHNSIFLRNGTEVILIPRSGNINNSYQLALNAIYPLNITYINSTLSIFKTTDAYACYIISEQLRNFFGDEFDGYDEDNFKTFLQYTKNAMNSRVSINVYDKNYYGSIFTDFMAQLREREDLITACNMPPHWETFQPPLGYQTHIGRKGWSSWIGEDQVSNDIKQNLDLQAIKIDFPSHKVYYSVYWNDKEGWSEEVSNSEIAGTTGKSKSIFGVRIRLDEAGAKDFDILYRVHKYDGQWTNWAKNGEVIYSHGQKLNAIQIKLVTKKS